VGRFKQNLHTASHDPTSTLVENSSRFFTSIIIAGIDRSPDAEIALKQDETSRLLPADGSHSPIQSTVDFET
jgi:hypothetical protein